MDVEPPDEIRKLKSHLDLFLTHNRLLELNLRCRGNAEPCTQQRPEPNHLTRACVEVLRLLHLAEDS